MLITHVEIYRFSIKMEPFVIATGTMDYAQNTLIKVYTDQGLIGFGECSAFPMIVGETQDTCLVLARDFAHIWKNKNPLDIKARLNELHRYIAGNMTIKSAFDMALYDLAAKSSGVPLYKYLKGEVKPITTDITVGIDAPEIMAQKALNFKEQGATILKVKLGKEPDEDIRRIKQIRDVIGSQIPIRIDANQGWTYNEAITVLSALATANIEFCEQPMRTYNDFLLPKLRSVSPIAIMADESCYDHFDAKRLIRENACDAINIKLAKSGGINEAMKIHDIAYTNQVPCMIGGMLESRLALSAKVHLAYACPGIKYFDMDTCMIGHLEDPITNGVTFDGFQVNITEAPGIGASVDDSFLKSCEKWVI
ncbi:dipeptide epimerase [Olivibacter sp. SDN3]|uniref:mandelate racemase/muconate lactonizing enzyme family protein n=1 Tax=Olivibacter sp. SDN3 TaxID=2764720 RepID=UPI001650EA41|nr:dipeptide epimerase [Olivibacter sp. SDN3]QNL48709.1 dipeptide epimerase [Olivibacter sp. SDN3]